MSLSTASWDPDTLAPAADDKFMVDKCWRSVVYLMALFWHQRLELHPYATQPRGRMWAPVCLPRSFQFLLCAPASVLRLWLPPWLGWRGPGA